MSTFRKVLTLFGVCLALTLTGYAQQNESQLSGNAKGPAGAALAGAKVVARHQTTGQTKETTTDSQGRYDIALAPGTYSIEVSGANLQPATKEFTLTAGQNATLDFQLALSPLSESVTITEGARVELERTPGGVAVVGERDLTQTRAYNLRDVFEYTPGVLAQSRFGSDEAQISIRGSGLRNNFHGRGVNINGMPHMDADGFSDFEAMDFLTAQRVEVWKGANALRYGGNTSGGAINLVTHTGKTAPRLELLVQGGSFGSFTGHLATGGERGRFNYFLSFTEVELEGYREHNYQGRQRVYGNFNFALNERTDFIVRSELRYDHPRGFWIAPNVDWSPATYFMDSANTALNDKYAVLNLRAGFDRPRWGIYFEAHNLTDRLYSAAVQVDSEAGTFFEPANGRSAYVGFRYRFGGK